MYSCSMSETYLVYYWYTEIIFNISNILISVICGCRVWAQRVASYRRAGVCVRERERKRRERKGSWQRSAMVHYTVSTRACCLGKRQQISRPAARRAHQLRHSPIIAPRGTAWANNTDPRLHSFVLGLSLPRLHTCSNNLPNRARKITERGWKVLF